MEPFGEFNVATGSRPDCQGFRRRRGATTGFPAAAGNDAKERPGAQLAQVVIQRHNDGFGEQMARLTERYNGFEEALGEGPPGSIDRTRLPGRFATATVYVDEVNLYAVRDIPAFYDEDLCLSALLP